MLFFRCNLFLSSLPVHFFGFSKLIGYPLSFGVTKRHYLFFNLGFGIWDLEFQHLEWSAPRHLVIPFTAPSPAMHFYQLGGIPYMKLFNQVLTVRYGRMVADVQHIGYLFG